MKNKSYRKKYCRMRKKCLITTLKNYNFNNDLESSFDKEETYFRKEL